MTAEEQLKELAQAQEANRSRWKKRGIKVGTGSSGLSLHAEQIDLIANLVVERLKK